MFRFFVFEKTGDFFKLSKEALQHLKVVRAEKEHFICVFESKFYECELLGDRALIIKEYKADHEFASPVVLAAALIETKNWEFMLQKAVELGVTKIIPVYSEHVSKKVPDLAAKLERWNKITLAAAEQSFRNVHPEVTAPMEFEQVIKLKEITHKYIAHEKYEGQIYKSFPQNSLFLIGPEGGFSDVEVKKALKASFKPISLGKRILRAETAALFVLAKVI